jgi:hypothetical protein
MNETETSLYRQLIAKKGIQHQLNKCAEEAAELAKAALKLQYLTETDPEYQEKRRDLAQEIADSQLTTEQMIDHFNLQDLIKYYRDMKLKRIQRIIEGAEE